jgi:predicted RNA-binding Zn ribbon-like protein
MEALFLAGHPALDFLNTTHRDAADGGTVEVIGNGEAFLAWLTQASLLDAAQAARLKRRLGAQALDSAAEAARRLRAWLASWLARWVDDPHASWESELRRLNGLLEQVVIRPELIQTDHGLETRERVRVETESDLLALVTRQVALLVGLEDPALIKPCAGVGCVLWFVDRTKAHRRMFCSATACGNRAKVAAFRERQRTR